MLRLTLLGCSLLMVAAAQPVDLLLVDGNIHTLDPARPHATALAVRAGRIVYVGDAAGAAPMRAEAKRVLDLHGATVVPGLNDAHMHLEGVGERELTFNLEGVPSIAIMQARLAERVALAGEAVSHAAGSRRRRARTPRHAPPRGRSCHRGELPRAAPRRRHARHPGSFRRRNPPRCRR
jgi:predicted amidohydrolase YtcJ